jgi:hypothetical protein
MSHIPPGNNAQGLTGRSEHDSRHFDEPRRGINGANLYGRPNSGVPAHNGHNSLPSSGSSTPLTARIPGQIPQSYTPDSTHTPFNQGYAHNGNNGSNNNNNPTRHGMPQMHNPSHLDSAFDWTSIQQQQSRDSQQLPSPAHHEDHLRQDNDSKIAFSSMEQQSGAMNYYPRDGSGQHEAVNNWSMSNTYKTKAERLTLFCQCDESNSSEHRIMKRFISPEMIEHLLQCYMHYDAHWPSLHLPTFDVVSLYDGLTVAMLCVGAVYSHKFAHEEVRTMLNHAQNLLQRATTVYKYTRSPSTAELLPRRYDTLLFSELAALQLIGITAWWHGATDQRLAALEDLPRYVRFAHRMGWFEPFPPSIENYSILHQPDPLPSEIKWDWNAWVTQEQRSRWAWMWWMADSALTLYCNSSPSIKPTDIKLPLPADDAAWEASTSNDCASALGLNGSSAQGKNISGSRRRKQPELQLAATALMDPSLSIAANSTNAFAKFILVHCLIIQIVQAHRQMPIAKGLPPSPQHSRPDWLLVTTATTQTQLETEEAQGDPFAVIDLALQKFKTMWDEDMAIQYPENTPRIGFCRDAIHFYWLARMLLRSDGGDWHAPWYQRFPQIFSALKQVRKWVASEAALRGEDIGSVVAIDDSFGIEDITNDMKLLFAPLGPLGSERQL